MTSHPGRVRTVKVAPGTMVLAATLMWLGSLRVRATPIGADPLLPGLEAAALSPRLPNDYQVSLDPTRPYGDSNSAFIALSNPMDTTRAPSSHPGLALRKADEPAYEARTADYGERLMGAIDRALPGTRRAVRFSLPDRPAMFESFTRKPDSLVDGFAQTSLFNWKTCAIRLVSFRVHVADVSQINPSLINHIQFGAFLFATVERNRM